MLFLVQVLVDMSCGSGLFSRRFVRSSKFAGVIAADFSESMLTQAKQFFDEDRSLDTRFVCSTSLFIQRGLCLLLLLVLSLCVGPLIFFLYTHCRWCRQYVLLRADVGRLPFPTGSVAAIHAGAAIHCWPNPTMAVGFSAVA